MATQPQYASTFAIGQVAFNTANTARDGTGTIPILYNSLTLAQRGAGATVLSLNIRATGITTLGMIRIFRADGVSAYTLLAEIPVTAITPSATVAAWSLANAYPASVDALGILLTEIRLAPGHSLRISTNNAENFTASCSVGEN